MANELVTSINNSLRQYENFWAAMVPQGQDYNRLARLAVTAIQNSGTLQECSPASLLGAIASSIELGLPVSGATQHAALVPYGKAATFQLMYKGMIALAYRSGVLESLDSNVVYEHDRFTLQNGTDPQIEHTPLLRGEKGEMVGVYAVAFLKDVARPAFEHLTKEDVLRVKNSSAAVRSGRDTPWKGEFESEMWRKTAIKRLFKRLPSTPVLAQAAHLDDVAITGGHIEVNTETGETYEVPGQIEQAHPAAPKTGKQRINKPKPKKEDPPVSSTNSVIDDTVRLLREYHKTPAMAHSMAENLIRDATGQTELLASRSEDTAEMFQQLCTDAQMEAIYLKVSALKND